MQKAVQGVFLSEKFLKQYEGLKPRNAGVLFNVLYLRTYCRWLPQKKRRETWLETITRVVEYSMSLYQGPATLEELQKEAEVLFDRIFHLEVLPAGRTLWVGGTESAKKFGESQYNCSFIVIDDIEAFGDIFQLLLCGCGTGFRVLESDVEKLPKFSTNFTVTHNPYNPKPKAQRLETTLCNTKDGLTIEIGDSREGWVSALRVYISFLTFMPSQFRRKITINYDSIRPAGERIVTFGGRAPGPNGLIEMFKNVEKVIKSTNGHLKPIDVIDICNQVAKNVIVGGTRRSSQVALGSPGDIYFLEAKKDLWKNKTHLHRTMSNNSVTFTSKPTKEKIQEIFEGIRNNGEPGFFNLESAQKRRKDAQGSNPCMEIIMDSRGFCNLCTLNLKSFVLSNNTFNYEKALDTIRLATRIGLRMTNVTVSLPKWDEVQKRDRLLGVSMTGIMDTFDALNWEFDSLQAISLLEDLRDAANDEADKYSLEMGVPRPKLVTCLKPEGSLSQLPTVSSGLHRAYAPHYIRRIRVSALDPVCMALQSLGVPNEPDQGKADRIVFSFPIKTEAKINSVDEPAKRQLERYLTTMKHYTNHNSSCTLTVGEDEWDEIVDMVYDNWDDIVAVAFLPKYTGDAYPQMPYEAITKDQYEEMMKTFPDLSNLEYTVNQFEQEEAEEDELDSDCSSQGYCPIR